VIEINNRGFKVLQPKENDLVLADFSHLIQVFLARNVWKTVRRDDDTFTNESTAVLDKTCQRRTKIAATLKSYYSDHDLVMDSIAGHSLEQIAAGLIKGAFELITIAEICDLPSIVNETLARYLLTTVGMERNPCEIKICTIDAHQFKKDCFKLLSGIGFILVLVQIYLFCGNKTILGKKLKKNLPVLQLCWPGPIGGLNLMMETYRTNTNRRNNCQPESTCSDNTLPTSDISSDTEFESFRANVAIKRMAIKKRVRGDRKLTLFLILLTLFFLFASVFLTSDTDLQNNYCKLLESLREEIL